MDRADVALCAMLRLMETQESETVAMAEAEARRLIELLATLVRLSKRSMRSLEVELQLSSSVVSKILSGIIRPQLSYLLMIAAAIGVKPEEFFALAYPQKAKARTANPLVRQMLLAEDLSEARELPEEVQDIDARIEEVVRRTLRQLGQGGS
jgi:transcriptional regulator with XRE-family HTH domain